MTREEFLLKSTRNIGHIYGYGGGSGSGDGSGEG